MGFSQCICHIPRITDVSVRNLKKELPSPLLLLVSSLPTRGPSASTSRCSSEVSIHPKPSVFCHPQPSTATGSRLANVLVNPRQCGVHTDKVDPLQSDIHLLFLVLVWAGSRLHRALPLPPARLKIRKKTILDRKPGKLQGSAHVMQW